MKTIKIGYTHWVEKLPTVNENDISQSDAWLDFFKYDLEKLDTWKDSTSGYTKCPAFIHYTDQIWVIKSLFDVELEWDDKKKELKSNLFPNAHDILIKSHRGDFNPYVGTPLVALNNTIVFFADEDVWIEMLPPFNHIDPGLRLLPASFSIYNWQRPVMPAFEMLKNQVKITRGQPLAYVRFRSSNPLDKFKLVRQEKTLDLEKSVKSASSLKFFQKNLSWKIAIGAIPNLVRPKNFFKKWFQKK